jgi:hypothetical protein
MRRLAIFRPGVPCFYHPFPGRSRGSFLPLPARPADAERRRPDWRGYRAAEPLGGRTRAVAAAVRCPATGREAAGMRQPAAPAAGCGALQTARARPRRRRSGPPGTQAGGRPPSGARVTDGGHRCHANPGPPGVLAKPSPRALANACRRTQHGAVRLRIRQGCAGDADGGGADLLVHGPGLPYEILSIHRVFDPKADTFVADREPQVCRPGRVGGEHFQGRPRGARERGKR